LKIYLLTHERELHKKSNTGQLVLDVLGDQAEVIVWKRKEPDLRLVHLLESGQAAMLYPDLGSKQREGGEQREGGDLDEKHGVSNAADPTETLAIADFQNFVILDSTWQEARKMYNKSAYLKQAEKVSLRVDAPSKYQLRRNQIEGGLSTVECVIALLKMQGDLSVSSATQIEALQAKFEYFNSK